MSGGSSQDTEGNTAYMVFVGFTDGDGNPVQVVIGEGSRDACQVTFATLARQMGESRFVAIMAVNGDALLLPVERIYVVACLSAVPDDDPESGQTLPEHPAMRDDSPGLNFGSAKGFGYGLKRGADGRPQE